MIGVVRHLQHTENYFLLEDTLRYLHQDILLAIEERSRRMILIMDIVGNMEVRVVILMKIGATQEDTILIRLLIQNLVNLYHIILMNKQHMVKADVGVVGHHFGAKSIITEELKIPGGK